MISNLITRAFFALLLAGCAELMATNPASTKYVQQYAAPATAPATPSATTYTIGQYAQGGIVFSLTPDNQHGLVIAIDGELSLPWIPPGASLTRIGAKGNDLSFGLNYTTTGKINTALIVANYGSDEADAYAAGACNAYTKTVNGVTYSGWYLPSLAELGLIQSMILTINPAIQAQGGAPLNIAGTYWSSFEGNTNGAWVQYFSFAGQNYSIKTNAFLLRAVRAF